MYDWEKVGPPGVLVFGGSTFSIADMKISMRPDGSLDMSSRPMISWEIWPLWVRIAIDELFNARVARLALSSEDGEESTTRAELISDETRSGMVAVCSSAFALEAMAIAAARAADIDHRVGANASSARRVAEVLKQCFEVPVGLFTDWRQTMINVFSYRNEAVHNDSRTHDPAPHPGVRAGVPRPAAMYRAENAEASVNLVFHAATEIVTKPRPRRPRPLHDKSEAWKQMGSELAEYATSRRADFLEVVEGQTTLPE